MIKQMHDLTGFQRDLLVLLEENDTKPSGTELKELVEAEYDEEINYPRVYTNLDRLERKGLIEKGEQDQRTNWYSVTADGMRELEDYREFVGGER